jgi:hypothetical protein
MNKSDKLYEYLKLHDESNIVLLTTKKRWHRGNDYYLLAQEMQSKLTNCEVIDISKLFSKPNEIIMDRNKNPYTFIRHWASTVAESDELYPEATKIFNSDIIIFFDKSI